MIIFLDYDGVVNSPMWYWDEKLNKYRCRYNTPTDNKVNNEQAVQWISELCEKFNANLVIISSWRTYHNYKECLINCGLRPNIKILGRTPLLSYETREGEIKQYIQDNNIGNEFLIIDDELYWAEDKNHFVHVTSSAFGINEYFEACKKIEKILGKQE